MAVDDDMSEKNTKVNDKVKVKTPPPSRVRPEYRCNQCDILFPSELDLVEHKRFDHKASVAA